MPEITEYGVTMGWRYARRLTAIKP